ncbi:F0F1 ATP synthase subunit epsilon [Candidatus Bipolaricaulota bacterium]|nr:F0F1 ATP synthase subunit epsilon [Candidatus Bipolaricaulota bacterium]
MHCTVRSADRTLVDGNAERIVARSPHGEFAVMDGHAPILAVLVPGVIRLQLDGEEHAIVCKGGTFSLADKSVTVLVERPYTLEEIDPDFLRTQLAKLQAEEPSASLSEEIAYLELLCRVKETHA